MADHEVKYFYLCAKETGFCGKEGPCESALCFHTTKEEQAKNHVGRKFVLIETPFGAERWEYETEEMKKELEKMKTNIEGGDFVGNGIDDNGLYVI